MVSCQISCIVCSKKIKASGSLPVIEKWESYMLPNHSSFPGIEDEHFLVGTRVHAALGKMTSQYLKKEFRSSARRFLEEFTSTVLSTVAARSKLGQGVSCFCPEIIIGGDDHSAFFLLGQHLDGRISCGWEKGSTIEACRAEFQSFVNDQRQQECHASRRHSDISNVVSYLTQQSGFRSRRHLYRVSLVGFQVGSVAVVKYQKLVWILSFPIDNIISTWSCRGDTPISTETWPRHNWSSLDWSCYLQRAKFCTGPSVHSAGFLHRQRNFNVAECCKRRKQCFWRLCVRPMLLSWLI